MGADFYILKVLKIYYSNSEYQDTIEISKERGYYDFDEFDEDEDDYDEKIKTYKNDMLVPRMNPIIIYNNKTFNKPSSKLKYKSMVKDKISMFGKKWSKITQIIKVEERYE